MIHFLTISDVSHTKVHLSMKIEMPFMRFKLSDFPDTQNILGQLISSGAET